MLDMSQIRVRNHRIFTHNIQAFEFSRLVYRRDFYTADSFGYQRFGI